MLESKINSLSDSSYVLTFISQKNGIVFETSSGKLFLELNNRIIFCLSENGESPIRVSEKARKNVIAILKEYMETDKKIGKLIHFFNDLYNDECIFVFPVSVSQDCFELLKKSLVYYNQNMDDQMVGERLVSFVDMVHEMESYLDEISKDYDSFMILTDTKKYLGEKDKSKRCCIYCGNKGEKNFIEKAHAIPEALGNEVIQNEECDECNSYFAKNIEEDFTNFLSFPRVVYGIDGKSGKPTMEYNDAEIAAKYLDFSKTELDWGRFNSIKAIAKDMPEYKGAVILDEVNSLTNIGLDLVNIKAVKPINIYRTLCKCVIGVVDNEIRKNFSEAIKWLRYNQHIDEKLPLISICCYAKICVTPQIMIYIKNNEKTELPYCFADLRIANFSFIFVIPFADKDVTDFADRENYENFLNSLKWIKKDCYTRLDFSSSENVNIRNILNFEMFKPNAG